MQRWFTAGGLLRHYVASILVVVFIALNFVPAGFMPATAVDGSTSFVLCSGVEQKVITVDENGQPIQKAVKSPCDFSLNASAVTAVSPVSFPAPVFTDIASAVLAARTILSSDASRAYTAQAPPIAF